MVCRRTYSERQERIRYLHDLSGFEKNQYFKVTTSGLILMMTPGIH